MGLSFHSSIGEFSTNVSPCKFIIFPSFVLQIVDYTRVSKKEANSKMFVPSISHSQFLKHQLGWFLGTVDVRKGSELEAECSLKFFEWSDVQSKYRLGAQVCSKVFALSVHFSTAGSGG